MFIFYWTRDSKNPRNIATLKHKSNYTEQITKTHIIHSQVLETTFTVIRTGYENSFPNSFIP